MKRMLGFVLSVILLSGLAATSYAQVGLYVGAYAGYSAQTPSFKDVKFDTDTTFLYGLRAGLKVLMLAVEIQYFTAMHNIEMSDFLLFNWNGKVNDYSFIGVGLRWIFSLAIFHPYLAAGYGYYTADIHNIDKDNEGGYNFGAGLEMTLGRHIALLVEGKYHHVTVNLSQFEVGLGNFTLSGGLDFYF
jgi:opacity protein-like surface antigen